MAIETAHDRFAQLMPIVVGMAINLRPGDDDLQQIGCLKLWELIAGDKDREDRYLVAAARFAMLDRFRYEKRRQKERSGVDVYEMDVGEKASRDRRRAMVKASA